MIIKAKTISDAWFQILYNLPDEAEVVPIDRGSFEKDPVRYQLPL